MVSNVIQLEPRTSDEELVAAALKGSQEAKSDLYRRHVRSAAGTAYRLLGSDTDLEDVVQDSFVAAFSTLDRLQDGAAFGGWLGRIVVRTAIDAIRRRRMLTRLGLYRRQSVHVETLVSTHAPADVVAELSSVYRHIETFPTAERVVLVLRRVEQLTIAEVAERTGWSPATVKRKLARAVARMEAAETEPT